MKDKNHCRLCIKITKVLSLLVIVVVTLIIIFHIAYMIPFSYEGDGKFIDRGYLSSSNRYVLTLDKINLSKPYKKTFLVGFLPRNDLSIGLKFKLKKGAGALSTSALGQKGYIHKMRVKLIMRDIESGKIKFKYSGKFLSDDIHNLVFRGGGGFWLSGQATSMSIDYYQKEDAYTLFGKPTGGNCNKKQKRKVTFEILTPMEKPLKDPYVSNFGELVIYGGGWK